MDNDKITELAQAIVKEKMTPEEMDKGVNGNLKLTPFRDNRQSKFDPLDDIKSVN